MYEFEFNIIENAIPYLIDGIKTTLFISIISSIIAFLIGIIVVFMRTMGEWLISFIGATFVEIIRNTPLLIQIYFVYKALPAVGINFHPILCGIIALSIYTGAYISEVLRSGVNSITQEQYLASKGLGLNKFQTFYLIIFPQAIRIAIPPLSSQFINLVKNSSLVSFIAVSDVFYVIYKGAVDDFRFFEFFIIGALIYMTITGFIAVISNLIEKYSQIPGNEAKA